MHPDKAIAAIRYPSLVQWLADRLVRANLESIAIAQADIIPLPLFSQSAHQLGTFASPLPLKGAKRGDNVGVQTLGTAMIQALHPTQDATFGPEFWMHPNGWFYVSFGAEDLAKWLQTLIGATPELWVSAQAEVGSQKIESGISNEPILFDLQYAHARCCSLLRLAQQEKFLKLDDAGIPCGHAIWQAATGELLLQTKSERALLRMLMEFPQSLSPQKFIYGCRLSRWPSSETRLEWSLPPKHLTQQAMLWSQLFFDFYRECRLFGEVQQSLPELARARFALIAIVKKVLAFLLEEMLRVKAPRSL
jgi:DALR anticodon binding domain